MSDETLLTVKQVAERLGVRRETVRKWINQGRLQGAMIGGSKSGYRICASEIDRLLVDAYPPDASEPPQIAGVYRITNTQTGYSYIGSSIDVRGRLAHHRVALNRGAHCNLRLQSDWATCGEAAFVMAVVEQTPSDNDALISAETRHLEAAHQQGRSYNRLGQNVHSGRHERPTREPRDRCTHVDPRGRCTAPVAAPDSAFCDRHLAARL